jgi:stage V sporulation protein S
VNVLKIAATSNPSAAAGALANTIREFGVAELQAIGPKAVNQAVKCIAIARGYMAPSGVDLFFVPSFTDVEINGEMKTALRFTVRSRTPVTSLRPRTRGGGADTI